MITGIFCLITMGISWADTKDVSFSFDLARLKIQKKGDAVLFCYNDTDCQYVEHGQGTPVLPCKHIYLVMPRGARYTGCRVNVTKEQLKGRYKLFTRTENRDVMTSARAYPSKLVEFVKQYDLDGYRIFMFRAYPIACQPADGSVARTIRLKMQVEYNVPEGTGTYPVNRMQEVARLKRLVINPDDFDKLSESYNQNPLDRIVSAPRDPQYLAREVFATKVGGEKRVQSRETPREEEQPYFRIFGDSTAPLDIIKNNFTVSDGGLTFTPIQF
jgi:hypothetical protein